MHSKKRLCLEGAKEELKKLAQRKAALIVKQNQQAKAQEEAKREQAQFTQQNAGRPQTSQGAVAPAYTFAAMGHSGNVSALSKQIEKTGNEIKAVNASIDAIGKEFGKKMLASESSPTSKSGTAGAQIDTTTKKTKKGKTKKQKPGKTVNPDDIASRKFSHDRQQDLEEVKRSYEEDLNALNEALAQKRLTQEQYNAYVSALNIEHQNNLLAIEKSYQEKANNLVIKDAAKKKTIKEQQNKAVADQQQAAYDAYVEAERQYYDALENTKQLLPNHRPCRKNAMPSCSCSMGTTRLLFKGLARMARDRKKLQKPTKKPRLLSLPTMQKNRRREHGHVRNMVSTPSATSWQPDVKRLMKISQKVFSTKNSTSRLLPISKNKPKSSVCRYVSNTDSLHSRNCTMLKTNN